MQDFIQRTLRLLRRLLVAAVAAVCVLSVLGVIVFAMGLLAVSLMPLMPMLAAPVETWLMTAFVLFLTGCKCCSYAFVAETFPLDKTCKAFKRGRSRSSLRNAFLWALIGNQVVHLPLGPLLVYLSGLMMMYLAAVASEPGPFWRTVALDWGVKHWLNQVDVLLVLAVIQGSWALVGATVVAYTVWLTVILIVNQRRSKLPLKAVLQRAVSRSVRHDTMFRKAEAFIRRLLS